MKEGIMDRWEHEVLQTAIRHYGPKHQILKAIEELSELQKELAKFLGGDRNFDRIAEETADVGIMLDQLELIFENREMVEVWREKKLERLARRMREESFRCEATNPPLTLDELREMDGEPVWCVDGRGYACWCLVNCYNDIMLCCDKESGLWDGDFYGMAGDGQHGLYEVGWLAYRRRPEDENHEP